MLGQGTITIQNTSWQVSIAADPVDLTKGLGGMASLPEGTGELFDLGVSQTIQVTTVPMLFSLDIAFLDENLVVTEVYRDILPGYLVTSQQPARYFLEVNAGELADVNPGDQTEAEITLQPVISTSSAGWLDILNTFVPLIMGTALIYPTETKEYPYEEPFKTAYKSFDHSLKNARIAIVIGYSFRDRGLMYIIDEAQSTNPNLKFIIICGENPEADTRRRFPYGSRLIEENFKPGENPQYLARLTEIIKDIQKQN